VTGHAPQGALLRKSGLRPGQALVLTKPLGTGTVLAAAMRGGARGRWVARALEEMQVSSGPAAAALAAFGATACTDVTGFGLLGHTAEMARASKV
jgi:selenide,water dikinase